MNASKPAQMTEIERIIWDCIMYFGGDYQDWLELTERASKKEAK